MLDANKKAVLQVSKLVTNEIEKKNVKEKPLLRVLRGEAVERPPLWLMRQAGRYLPEYREMRASVSGFLELCYTPEKAAEVTLQPIRRFGFDAAILFADILLLPHALGQSLTFEEGEGPRLEAIRDRDGVERLDLEQIDGHLGPVYETVKRLREVLPSETALIGFAGAPWTVATYMVEGESSRDFTNVKGWAFSRPDDFDVLIDLLVRGTVHYLAGQIRAGAEVIQLFDTWAGVLPEEEFRRFVIAPTKRIIEDIKIVAPNVPVIGFPRGAGVLLEAYAKETCVDAVGLDSSVSLAWAAAKLQPVCTVQGNLDPVLLLGGGTPMQQAAHRILDAFAGGPFIFNLGHGILPITPPEHVADLVRSVRSWRA